MSYCLCCNSLLVRQISHSEVYLYCPDCRQAMPEAKSSVVNHPYSWLSETLSKSLVSKSLVLANR